ncbi:MAG: zinc-binding protein [Burkholderiaceae bacterium]|nr:zinc-binding protein [Burkholderiaceae bacterium]
MFTGPTPRTTPALPLVYSCSGCSSAAQLANHVAVRLDREGVAEMSCIAGLGGDVPSLVRKAEDAVAAGRAVLAIDGCVLACVRNTLARHGVVPSHHVELWRLGVRKRQHEDFSPAEAAEALAHCRSIAGCPGVPESR